MWDNGEMKRHLALALLLVVLTGCGGSSTSRSSRHAGIFSGTLTDSSDGKPVTIETEQHVRGTALNGSVRLTKDGKGYHGVLTGTVSGDAYSWHAKFGGGMGEIDASGNAATGTTTITYNSTNGELHAGAGSMAKTAEAPTADLSGTYTLSWTSSLGDSNTVDLVVSFVKGQNVVVEQVSNLPAGGGYIIAGSVVGTTIATTQFSGAAPAGVLTHFASAPIGGTGTLSGQTFGPNPRQFTGTYSISSQPSN